MTFDSMSVWAETKDAVTVRVALLVFGALALQALFILSYVGALHHPKASKVPFGLVSPDSAQMAATLNGLPGDPLDVRVSATEAAARDDVLHRRTYGALIVDPAGDSDTLLVASGAGAALAETLEQVLLGLTELVLAAYAVVGVVVTLLVVGRGKAAQPTP